MTAATRTALRFGLLFIIQWIPPSLRRPFPPAARREGARLAVATGFGQLAVQNPAFAIDRVGKICYDYG